MDRERLEIELYEQLQAAQKSLDEARKECTTARAACGDAPDTADGTFAIHQAAKRELTALDAYKTALKRFSDLVVYGQLPEDHGTVDDKDIPSTHF